MAAQETEIEQLSAENEHISDGIDVTVETQDWGGSWIWSVPVLFGSVLN